MGDNKFKKIKIYIILFFVYIIVGIVGYFAIKEFYHPDNLDENSRDIANAIEIYDESGLEFAMKNNKNTYALIYGEFKAKDIIDDKFLNNKFSYVNEVKVDSRDNTRESRYIKESKEYTIYDIKVDGINFDIMEKEKYRTINDIRNRKITYEYYVKRASYTGTMLCLINDDKIDMIKFYKDETIQTIRNGNIGQVRYTENGFVIAWVLFFFLFLIGIDDVNEDDYTLDVRE